MFNTLVESDSKTARRTRGTLFSILAHYGLILAAIYTSAQAESVHDGPKQEKIDFVEPVKDPVQKEEVPPPELIAAPPPLRSVAIIIAPIEIPSVLPDIDLRQRPTDPNDFTGKGPPRVYAASPDSAVGVDGSSAYHESQVERPVMLAPNSATPAYPDILRQAGIEGEVLVSFVVDTSGRVEVSSFKVIRATHESFATAVKNALPRMRFIPAELGTHKVRQLVQQPYSFAIVKETGYSLGSGRKGETKGPDGTVSFLPVGMFTLDANH